MTYILLECKAFRSWVRKGSKFWVSEGRCSCAPVAIRALGRCPKHGYNLSMEGIAMGSPARIRILTVEDHPVFRAGLSTIIGSEQDMLLVAQAANAVEAIAEFRRHRPDITLMDLRLPGTNGTDALIAIRGEFPKARI